MQKAAFRPEWHRAIVHMSAVVIAAMLIAGLSWARTILIPIALAIFLTFVLAPVVRFLERRKVGRLPAVLATVGLAVLIGVGTFWVVGAQVSGLTRKLPDYIRNIEQKAGSIREWVSGTGESRFGEFFKRVQEAVAPTDPSQSDGAAVVVREQGGGWQTYATAMATPAVELLGQGAFASILTVFMLLKREDLRNRMLRLAGAGHVTTATKAMDDASRRVSRFLLVQLLINTSFGLVVTVALYAAGVSFAPLWGFIGTLMRYVPYIGTWIGIIPPLLFTAVMSDGFAQPLIVLAVFLGLELTCNNIFEPWLYGRSLGISEVAQLVAAAFWAFLWGPIGLILSGPLTTCLLVLGKYNPRFEFLDVLLGDTPPLAPSVAYFQRLTARDQDEAERIATASVDSSDPARVMDEVIFPALRLTRTAAIRGELAAEEEKFIFGASREIIDELTESLAPHGEVAAPGDRVRLLACPARDDADRVALEGLARVLPADKWEVEVTSAETLSSEVGAIVQEFRPAVVCVASLPPGGVSHTRYLCKRLRNRFPELKIVIARWGVLPEDEETLDAKSVGADAIYPTLAAAREELTALHAVFQQITETADAVPGPREERTPGGKLVIGTASA